MALLTRLALRTLYYSRAAMNGDRVPRHVPPNRGMKIAAGTCPCLRPVCAYAYAYPIAYVYVYAYVHAYVYVHVYAYVYANVYGYWPPPLRRRRVTRTSPHLGA